MTAAITTGLWLLACAVCMLDAHVERRRRQRAEFELRGMVDLMKSTAIVGAMIRGVRPVVTSAPAGMTLEEAQAKVNDLYDSLAPEWSKRNALN